MKIFKPKFWDKKKNIISILLLPFSLTLQLVIFLMKKITFKYNCNIPVICIGNLYLGGTGKTPLSISLAIELSKIGKKPAIIKKFYSNQYDEHNLINTYTNYLFLDKKRINAIRTAESKGHDIAILDDGFQDYSIKKDLNILCFNGKQLAGNEMTIPSGPLRESLNSIKSSQIVVINGNKDFSFEKKITDISNEIKIFYTKYVPVNIAEFKNKKLYAFAGIGNPANFFDLLVNNNLDLRKKLEFPDHYEFKKTEIEKMINESSKNGYDIITTEKDFLRIKKFGFKNISFLKLKLEILEKEKMIENILNLI